MLRHLLKNFYRAEQVAMANSLKFSPILDGTVFFQSSVKSKFMKGSLTLARQFFQKLILLCCGVAFVLVTLAQDKKEIDVNVSTNKNNFWGQPWVWVVGAAVFILLLVAILRSGRRGDA